MTFEFELPDVGEGVAEGEIVAWHVEPGETVTEDQVLAEVETDKAVVDLPSPVAGVVRELHAAEGEVVPVGTVVVTIDTEDDADAAEAESEPSAAGEGEMEESPASDATDEEVESAAKGAVFDEAGESGVEQEEADAAGESGEETGPERVFAPPRVRRLAREVGVDLSQVEGTGPGGRLTEADVRRATNGADADATAEATPAGGPETAAPEASESPSKSAVRRRTEAGDSDTAAGEASQPDAGAQRDEVSRDRTLAAPATRELARELDVDIDTVPTDRERDGEPFVEPDDVRAHAEGREGSPEAQSATGEAAHTGEKPVTREPYRGIRRTIGERMAKSASAIPHATHHDTAEVSRLVEMRTELTARAEERGVDLTYMPFVMKAVVAGLQAHPVLNTELDEAAEEIVYKEYYDLGVAVATDDGLLVPVVEDVDEKGLLELAAEVNDVVERARARDLTPQELRGSTFTITNFGAIGGEYATPIINHPETAILGLGRIEQRPVVADADDGAASSDGRDATGANVVARHTLPLSLSIDHRVIDGAEGAQFCNTVKEYLENPSLLLL